MPTRKAGDALVGEQTRRALETHAFSASCLGDFPDYVRAMLQVKMSAAQANLGAKTLSDAQYKKIHGICQDLSETKDMRSLFVADVYQGGGGIALNMNVNEVLAALLTGKTEESYAEWLKLVNQSQSTADVCATAGRIAVWRLSQNLLSHLNAMVETVREKSVQLRSHKFMARTCMQDAMPTNFESFFRAWVDAIVRTEARLSERIDELLKISLGGTVIGSGEGASEEYRHTVVNLLARHTGMRLVQRQNLYDAAQHSDDLLRVFNELNTLSTILLKMSKDLRLLSSGPKHGFAELTLPKVIKGSSFFSDKNNPTVPETMMQCAFLVSGWRHSAQACMDHAELNLNVFEPMVVFCLYRAVQSLSDAVAHLDAHCLRGLDVGPKGMSDV